MPKHTVREPASEAPPQKRTWAFCGRTTLLHHPYGMCTAAALGPCYQRLGIGSGDGINGFAILTIRTDYFWASSQGDTPDVSRRQRSPAVSAVTCASHDRTKTELSPTKSPDHGMCLVAPSNVRRAHRTWSCQPPWHCAIVVRNAEAFHELPFRMPLEGRGVLRPRQHGPCTPESSA